MPIMGRLDSKRGLVAWLAGVEPADAFMYMLTGPERCSSSSRACSCRTCSRRASASRAASGSAFAFGPGPKQANIVLFQEIDAPERGGGTRSELGSGSMKEHTTQVHTSVNDDPDVKYV